MTYTNSKLATYYKQSPNYTNVKNGISHIIPHYMAGNMTAKGCVDYFANAGRQASSQYCIGSDGAIAQSCHEKYRAWTSGTSYWDSRSCTIETANISNTTGKITDEAMKSLIKLCADICKRNGIKKCTYTGTTSGTLLRHNMFQSTSCPGKYIQDRLSYIASEVNKLLGMDDTVKVTSKAYFRDDAYVGAKKIKALAVGTKVEYIEDDGYGWGKIKVDGKTGYAINSCLSNKNETTWCPNGKVTVAVYVKNSKGTKLIKVPKGGKIKVYSTNPKTGKAYVKYADIKGWIDNDKINY